jgi:hypothetical protein
VQPQRKERLDNLENEDRDNPTRTTVPYQEKQRFGALTGFRAERTQKNSPGGP